MSKKDPPEQQRFTLLYRGRKCRVYRTIDPPGTPGGTVQIQFESGLHTAVVSRSEVLAPNGEEFRGPDV